MADLETDPLLSVEPLQYQTSELITKVYGNRISDSAPSGAASTQKRIGWSSAYILVISRVIGSGIFAMPGTILQESGSPGLALILWIVGALIAWASLAIDLEYGCMLPVSGGMKVYLEFTYPWPRFLASMMVAVSAVLLGFTATNCIVFAKYTLFAMGQTPVDLNTKSLAIGMLTLITIIHGCFPQTGIRIQNALGWLKIVLIVFMILTGIAVVFGARAPSNSFDGLFDESNWGFNDISTALFKVIYSYAGLNNVNNVMNEVKNPVRTLKSVTLFALLTACLMYALINIAYLSVVPLNEIKHSRELIAALYFEKVFGPGFGNIFLPLAIALSAAGNVMVVTYSLARVNQEVAKQGFLPWADLLASSRPFNAPLGGLIIHYIPSLLVIVLPPSSTVYAFIADVEGYASQFFAVAVAIGLLLLRKRKPDLPRPFRAWLPAVWLRLVLCVILIMAPVVTPVNFGGAKFSDVTYALVAVTILLFGVSYWYIFLVAVPSWQGKKIEEEVTLQEDGTKVVKLVKKPA